MAAEKIFLIQMIRCLSIGNQYICLRQERFLPRGGTSRGQMEFRVMPPSSYLHTLLVTRSGMHVSVSLASSINPPIPRKVTYESIDMTPSIAQNSTIQYSSFGCFSLCHLIHCSRFQHMNAVLDATRRPLGCTITCKPREMG